jgi:FlaA1/EpsC-like NDP-sugar epimerase
MEDIVILGAGGLAREVAFLIEDINRDNPKYNLLGFIVRDDNLKGRMVGKYSVIGNEEWLADKELNVVIGIGNPRIVYEVSQRVRNNISNSNSINTICSRS